MDQDIVNEIRHLLQKKERICLFIGAGASIKSPTCLPSFKELNCELLSILLNRTSMKEKVQTAIQGINTKPEHLLQIIWDYTNGQFNPVESFDNSLPNINHTLIATLVANGASCIITPNFDQCIESALDGKQIKYKLFNKTPTTKNESNCLLRMIRDNRFFVWKPHGDSKTPETLCYTRTKVAKLNCSTYLRDIFSYVLKNYHVIFLGYSGYDDDFFPLIYENMATSNKLIIWNSYKEPKDTDPCKLLEKHANKNFRLFVGDMTMLLCKVLDQKEEDSHIVPKSIWKNKLKQQFSKIGKSTQIAILGKYFFDFGLVKESELIWTEGLNLPTKDLSAEDLLKFQMNLGLIDYTVAYKRAIVMKKYYIAEIALENLISTAIYKKDFPNASYYMNEYQKNTIETRSNYFKESKCMYFDFLCKLQLYDNKIVAIENRFEKVYQALMKDGEIIYAIGLIVKYYGIIASKNQGTISILNKSMEKIQQLIPYGINTAIADAYYFIANLAITFGEKDIALVYHDKCVEIMDLCIRNRTYQSDQMHELLSCIYHQGAMLATSRHDAIKQERCALLEAEQIQEKLTKSIHKSFIYNGLCSIYMNDNYQLAVKYGALALEWGIEAQSTQNLARTYLYLAVADAQHNFRQEAIEKFRVSYSMHLIAGEGLQPFFDYLDKCSISVEELKE